MSSSLVFSPNAKIQSGGYRYESHWGTLRTLATVNSHLLNEDGERIWFFGYGPNGAATLEFGGRMARCLAVFLARSRARKLSTGNIFLGRHYSDRSVPRTGNCGDVRLCILSVGEFFFVLQIWVSTRIFRAANIINFRFVDSSNFSVWAAKPFIPEEIFWMMHSWWGVSFRTALQLGRVTTDVDNM